MLQLAKVRGQSWWHCAVYHRNGLLTDRRSKHSLEPTRDMDKGQITICFSFTYRSIGIVTGQRNAWLYGYSVYIKNFNVKKTRERSSREKYTGLCRFLSTAGYFNHSDNANVWTWRESSMISGDATWSSKPCSRVIFFAMKSASSNSDGSFLVETKQEENQENPISGLHGLVRNFLTDANANTPKLSIGKPCSSWRRRRERKFETVARARQFVKSRSPWGWKIENPWLQFARANARCNIAAGCLHCRTTPSFRVSIAVLLDILSRIGRLVGCLEASCKSALLSPHCSPSAPISITLILSLTSRKLLCL